MENFFLGNVAQSFSDIVHRIIGNTLIVEYGIIKDVPADGIVTVAFSVAKDKSNVVITNCVLVNLASTSLTVNIKPNIDDKVLILFPRRFCNDMFAKESNEPVIYKEGNGYSINSGIAILINQFQEFHKNFIDIADGTVNLKLAYKIETDDNGNETEDSRNLVSLEVDENGNTTASSEGTLATSLVYSEDDEKFRILFSVDSEGAVQFNSNDLFTMNIDAEGAINVQSNDVQLSVNTDNEINVTNSKSTVLIDKDGALSITTPKATVSIDSSGNVTMEAQGKFSIKNNATDLLQVIDGLAKEVENLTTVGSPATQSTSPASKGTISAWRSSKLNQLLQ